MLLSQIIINEVYPNPLTNEKEWVEIISSANNATNINLSNWTIWDQLSQPSLIYSFSNNIMEPGGCYTIEFSNKLNNSADGVVIKNPDQESVDQMSYDYSEAGKSWQRVSLENNQFALTEPSQCELLPSVAAVSPTQITTTPLPEISPTDALTALITPTFTPTTNANPILTPTSTVIASNYEVQLSEVMACPEERAEWIELYNPNDLSISLTNWTIWDSLRTIYTFSQETIDHHGYLSIDINNKLNNSGDQVILQNGLGETISHFSYDECTKGTSFIYYQNSWQITENPSKNLANILQTDQDFLDSVIATNTDQTNSSVSGQINKNEVKDHNDANRPKLSSKEKSSIVNKNLLNIKLKIPDNPAKKDTNNIFFNPIQVNKGDILSVIIGGILVSSLGAYGYYAQIYKHN